MKKETIAAVVFGILFGVVGAVVMVGRVKQLGTKNILPAPAKKKVVSQSESVKPLTIASPKDKAITSQKTITIKGKTTPNSLIIIQSPVKEAALNNKKEDFSTEFPLALGENVILITAYPRGTQSSPEKTELKVYYLEEK